VTGAFEVLAEGFTLVEGPCVDPSGALYFSDIYEGGVYRRSPDGEVAEAIPKRRAVGGIAAHADGGIVVTGRNVQHVDGASVRVLLEDPAVRSYNDLMVDPEGRVLVGSVRDRDQAGRPIGGPGMTPADRQRPFGELYRIGGDGPTMLYEFDGLSNGIALSHAWSRMTHVSSVEGLIVHDIAPDGSLTRRASPPVPPRSADGLCADTEDHLWAAGLGAVTRYAPDGSVALRLDVPAERVISLCFGPGGHDLFVTSGSSTPEGHDGRIFRTTVEVPGLVRPLARV
jgi:sugar lactone lactonase YvrE